MVRIRKPAIGWAKRSSALWVRITAPVGFIVLFGNAWAGDFTYQGQLTDQGAPITGNFQAQFKLFDMASGGNEIGQPLTNTLAVTNGLFTMALNFGDDIFGGSPIWLELGIRSNSDLPFVILSPRQPVTGTPHAFYADQVGAAGIGGVIPDQAIGTNIARLNADAIFTGAVQFSNPSNVFAGTFLGDGSGLSNVNASGLTGGINTTNPQIHGVVTYGTDIASVAEQVSTNYDYPTAAPAGYIWRSLDPTKDAAGHTGWCWVGRSAITLNSPWAQPVLPTGWPTVTCTEFAFGMDGNSFVIVLRGNGSYLGVQVDGADDGFRWLTAPDVHMHYYTVNFATSARRQIALELAGNYQFGGIFVPATNGLWPPVLPVQHRLIVMGDSFSEEITASAWTTDLMQLFRNVDVWSSSVGATGYLNPGPTGRVNFPSRIGPDIISNQPDYVLFAGGINDNTMVTNGTSAAALQAACVSCYQAIQSQLPNCKIIVLGPFWPGTPGPPSIYLVNNAISNACQIVGIGSNYIDTLSDPWVTGVWNQLGSGSAVRYTLSDGTHPTGEGAWNLAYHVATELARRFLEFQPREPVR
jgi:hypothetical protein